MTEDVKAALDYASGNPISQQHALKLQAGSTLENMAHALRVIATELPRLEAERDRLAKELAEARKESALFCGDNERLIKATGTETRDNALTAIGMLRERAEILRELRGWLQGGNSMPDYCTDDPIARAIRNVLEWLDEREGR